MNEYSSHDVALYVNAINKTMAKNGVTKTISDAFWTSDIVPILYPLWDSDRDKLESFIRYNDGVSLMNKNKYQRNQKTGAYKWVSYEMDLAGFEKSDVDDLYTRLSDKFVEYRGLDDTDLETQLAAKFAKEEYTNWTKIRLIRNFLLMDSDWTQLGDAPLSTEEKAKWVTYRQKLRDIPEEQKDNAANAVVFPITPSKHAKLGDGLTYLGDVSHFYTIPQSVYSKFSTRIVNYLALAIGTAAIDEMPVTSISRPNTSLDPNTGDNDLDNILKMIDEGDFGE